MRLKSLIMGCIIMLMMTLAFTLSVKAEENQVDPPDDFGDPISVTTYVEEDGSVVTERIYFYSDCGSSLRDKSGSGWYKNEKEHEWTGGDVTTYYAQGYFVWGNGEVSVSSPSGDASSVPYIVLTNPEVTSGTGKYAGIFNNYAYVTYSVTATNWPNFAHDLSVTIRISESGNAI